jgi:hypothetical protein
MSFIQARDVFDFGRLAWELFRYGWAEECQAGMLLYILLEFHSALSQVAYLFQNEQVLGPTDHYAL